jgi:hypothetical protein
MGTYWRVEGENRNELCMAVFSSMESWSTDPGPASLETCMLRVLHARCSCMRPHISHEHQTARPAAARVLLI